MATEISTVTRTEVLGAIRNRCLEASKGDKSRMLDEFVALTGCHRKHAVRLLNQCGWKNSEWPVPRGKRIYDEAVRQALIVVWEAADRICGKRLSCSAKYGRVTGKAWPPRPRPGCAGAIVLGECQYHGPSAETGEGTVREPTEGQEEDMGRRVPVRPPSTASRWFCHISTCRELWIPAFAGMTIGMDDMSFSPGRGTRLAAKAG